ncbi:hypothetical protein [Streptomyces cylindrosporus]|uniref:Uncharacterized protein n=1 Tax=Streptomyces cylindrosporus TaxID=2927583 RepID=A0ABS9YM24_9ACTN|nr:hypothetical protein [Streptomyces cylindrosporus]MCI3277600.1 hypothetical protein [Streptomyces cylindrosporus]
MATVEISLHGRITSGPDEDNPAWTLRCSTCGATPAHTIRGDLGDETVPVTLTCVNGHEVPTPDWLDARELLFTIAMRAE